MKSAESYFKLFGLLICLAFILIGSNNSTAQIVLFGIILLSIGIPHGAIDHLTSQPKQTKKSLTKFLLIYLGLIGLYIGLWFFAAKLAILFFLVFSAYHFGQTHFLNRFQKLSWQGPLLFLSRGIFLLSTILFGSFETTAQILSSMISVGFLEAYAVYLILIPFGGTILMQAISKIKFDANDLLDLFVLPVLLYFSPLFVSFAVYFGFWHSLPSMISEYVYLSGFPQYRGVKKFVLQLLPFSLISIVGIAIILLLGINSMEMGELTLLFFVLISLISFPHVIYMDSFFKKSAKIDPYSA